MNSETTMNNKYDAVMVDLETMGNIPSSPIVSIGAVPFDYDETLNLNALPKFHAVVDLESSMSFGLQPNASTIYWWMQQSDEARAALTAEIKLSLPDALMKFKAFFLEYSGKDIWAHATFDIPILASSFEAIGSKVPWHYRAARDIRTLNALYKMAGYGDSKEQNKTMAELGLVEHNAADDALYQVYYTRKMITRFKHLGTFNLWLKKAPNFSTIGSVGND